MFAGAAETDWSLPQAELQPGVSWSEVPDWSPGQAPLPQDHQRAPQLRRQVLLHQHAGLLRRDCDPRQSQVWNQSNQQSQKYCGQYQFFSRQKICNVVFTTCQRYDYKHCCVPQIFHEKFKLVKVGFLSTTAEFEIEKVICLEKKLYIVVTFSNR